jgi:hypothetical protein
VVFADQFAPSIAADLAEAVIGVNDGAIGVGNADDGMLVKGEFLVGQRQPSLFIISNQLGNASRETFNTVFKQRLGSAFVGGE